MQSCLALIPDDSKRVYLAYSGGLDSSVLLHLLVDAKPGYQIIPWHVNHGLLDAAVQMEQFCIDQARAYDLELRLDRLEPGAIDSNVEAEARRQRYAIFENGLDRGDCLLTAHHADDQAETFLLNALRGSGSAGLRGIAGKRKLGAALLLRPMLEYSRRELEDYANAHELAWFNDPSNRDTRFDRNYLRNEVMPLIAARWPHFQAALSRTSQLQGETQCILDEIAQADFESVAAEATDEPATLELAGLLQLSEMRIKNLLRYWVARAGLPAIPGARIREVVRQLRARADASPRIAMPSYSIRIYDRRLFLVPDDIAGGCEGAFDFGLKERIEIDACDLHLQRAQLFARLGVDDRGQRVVLRFRGKGQLSADNHRLKRLFQKHRVPPWRRQSTPQVYLDERLAGLLT